MNKAFLEGYMGKTAFDDSSLFDSEGYTIGGPEVGPPGTVIWTSHDGTVESYDPADVVGDHFYEMEIYTPEDLQKILEQYPDPDEYDPRIKLFLKNLDQDTLFKKVQEYKADMDRIPQRADKR